MLHKNHNADTLLAASSLWYCSSLWGSSQRSTGNLHHLLVSDQNDHRQSQSGCLRSILSVQQAHCFVLRPQTLFAAAPQQRRAGARCFSLHCSKKTPRHLFYCASIPRAHAADGASPAKWILFFATTHMMYWDPWKGWFWHLVAISVHVPSAVATFGS